MDSPDHDVLAVLVEVGDLDKDPVPDRLQDVFRRIAIACRKPDYDRIDERPCRRPEAVPCRSHPRNPVRGEVDDIVFRRQRLLDSRGVYV